MPGENLDEEEQPPDKRGEEGPWELWDIRKALESKGQHRIQTVDLLPDDVLEEIENE